MTALAYSEVLVNQGGLMRCCLATLADFLEAHAAEPAVEGFVLDCVYEQSGNANMILEGKVFRWNRPTDFGAPHKVDQRSQLEGDGR